MATKLITGKLASVCYNCMKSCKKCQSDLLRSYRFQLSCVRGYSRTFNSLESWKQARELKLKSLAVSAISFCKYCPLSISVFFHIMAGIRKHFEVFANAFVCQCQKCPLVF